MHSQQEEAVASALRELLPDACIPVPPPILRRDAAAALGLVRRRGLANVKHSEGACGWRCKNGQRAIGFAQRSVEASPNLADLHTKPVTKSCLGRSRTTLFGLRARQT